MFKVGDRVRVEDGALAVLTRLIPETEAFAGEWECAFEDDGAEGIIADGEFTVVEPATDYTPTLRDQFAMAALTGVIRTCKADTLEPRQTMEQHFANKAYAVADSHARSSGGEVMAVLTCYFVGLLVAVVVPLSIIHENRK